MAEMAEGKMQEVELQDESLSTLLATHTEEIIKHTAEYHIMVITVDPELC